MLSPTIGGQHYVVGSSVRPSVRPAAVIVVSPYTINTLCVIHAQWTNFNEI